MLTNGFSCLDVELLNAITNNSPHAIKFLTVMTLCNTVTPIKRLNLRPSDSFAQRIVLILLIICPFCYGFQS
jgi:hypothetical protein